MEGAARTRSWRGGSASVFPRSGAEKRERHGPVHRLLFAPRPEPESPEILGFPAGGSETDGYGEPVLSAGGVRFARVSKRRSPSDDDVGALETNLARVMPLRLQGGAAAVPDSAALQAHSAFGSITIAPGLRPIDLKVLASIIGRWQQADLGTRSDEVPFSLYRLGWSVYGRTPTGGVRKVLRASLAHLRQVRVTVYGSDATRDGRPVRRLVDDGHLLISLETAFDDVRYDAPLDPREVAGERGGTYRVMLHPWLTGQLRHGGVTELPMPTMRALNGLALRLWVYLQAAPYTDVRADRQTLAVSPPVADLAGTLGMNFARETDARKVLRRAAARVQDVDRGYRAVDVTSDPKTGRWHLHATRARPRSYVQEVLPV